MKRAYINENNAKMQYGLKTAPMGVCLFYSDGSNIQNEA